MTSVLCCVVLTGVRSDALGWNVPTGDRAGGKEPSLRDRKFVSLPTTPNGLSCCCRAPSLALHSRRSQNFRSMQEIHVFCPKSCLKRQNYPSIPFLENPWRQTPHRKFGSPTGSRTGDLEASKLSAGPPRFPRQNQMLNTTSVFF